MASFIFFSENILDPVVHKMRERKERYRTDKQNPLSEKAGHVTNV